MPVDSFQKDNSKWDGLHGFCKECKKIKDSKIYYEDPKKKYEKVLEYQRRTGRIRKYKPYNPAYYSSEKSQKKKRARDLNRRCLKRKADEQNRITPEVINAVIEKYDGKCAYCGTDCTKYYEIDHKLPIVKVIDLFAGIGGIRKGFELACADANIDVECVFTSEIKKHAIEVLKQNHPAEVINGDITQVFEKDIPDFDVLLAGFPCQAFSAAGKRLGFEDTRGTLFFHVARILKAKKPAGFVLENVEGLVNHDKVKKSDSIGRTLQTILNTLDELGYKVSWKVLNAKNFGVPQDRRRIYIVGSLKEAPNLENFPVINNSLENILDYGLPVADNPFVKNLLKHYKLEEVIGKQVKDKRGGEDNIHSWDLEMKGPVTTAQKKLLNVMMTERRKKKWAAMYGIDWMDGMPLTLDMIKSFWGDDSDLKNMLDDLAEKRYVVREHPKKKTSTGQRIQDTSLPIGYNIVAGKLSFEVSKILDPAGIAPTLVATDMQHLYVPDGDGIRKLSLREGLRLFGYPDDFKFRIGQTDGYDLLGNTVVVPVIKAVSERLLNIIEE